MKKPRTYLYIISCAIFLSLSIIFFLASNSKTIYKLNYQEKGDISYQVYLKDNNYYDSLFLEEDMKYISDIIDYIDIAYNYSLMTSNVLKVTSSNLIRAKIILEDSNKILYNKNIVLKDIEVNDYKTNNINLNKKVKIDYYKYNDLVKSLLNEYNLDDNVSSRLEIELYILNDYDIEKMPSLNTDEKSIKLIIPLLENTISISKEYVNIYDNRDVKEIAPKEINNYILLGISIFFLVVSIIIFIVMLISIKNNNFYRHQYRKMLINILRKYDKNIVNVKDTPDMRGYEVYNVESFSELLDTSKIYNKPIMYLEIEKDRASLFFVEENGIIYQYLMRTKK